MLSSILTSRVSEVSVNIHSSKIKCAVFTKLGPLKTPCTSWLCRDISVLLDSCWGLFVCTETSKVGYQNECSCLFNSPAAIPFCVCICVCMRVHVLGGGIKTPGLPVFLLSQFSDFVVIMNKLFLDCTANKIDCILHLFTHNALLVKNYIFKILFISSS